MKLRLFVAALALACSGVAEAQGIFVREVTTAEAARTLHDFSECVVIRAPRRAREILALDFTTEEYRERIRAFAQRYVQCVPRGHRLGFSSLPFAGDMAEVLLRTDSTDFAVRVRHDASRPPLVARSETETMALCAVRAAPHKTAALLSTRAFSTEERAAVEGIMPEVRSCLSMGVRLNLNRTALRSMLALAAYRLAEHNRAPVAQSAAASGS